MFQSPKLATAYERTLKGLNEFIGSDIALGGIVPHLDRLHDFPAFAQTCRNWNSIARITRATHPSCARDVRIAVGFGLHSHHTDGTERINADGEYELLYGGLGPPMVVYCHNVLTNRPTEFLSLKGNGRTNYSYAPSGGSCRGSSVRTEFTKVRFDSWSLTVKTDDYTFAKTVGGPLKQTYWNGARTVDLDQVPYATARDSLGHYRYATYDSSATIDDPEAKGDWPLLNDESGRAMLDLRGTGFGVEDAAVPLVVWGVRSPTGRIALQAETTGGCHQWIHIAGGGYAGRLAPRADRTLDETAGGGNYDDEGEDASGAFGCMGCSPTGRIALHAETTGGCHQWIHIAGGGYAGRLAPRADRTLDETAGGGNYDDEGKNGGWVLPLTFASKEEQGDTKEERKWTVTQAVNINMLNRDVEAMTCHFDPGTKTWIFPDDASV
eukprot:CAMPEP_0194447812 /NCGR_PEP_ID=MMETSP0176-20130528/129222_1 /TAXON_ID=216777 /ORGANISM="Proboscia alata, Strain PI-D3" /LENGTH=437 /DNA_ID=CAMNT_0039274715 /DNA_START=146 /DNA_END=1462 /DNA_ORIENTATION=+